MATLKLENLKKVYDGGVVAVHDFNIDIKDGEFIVLVGPSGCGKSTTLRMVAGLEDISDGKLMIGDKDCTNLPAKDRDIAMVFQNYALYANMTVYENMAFSLTLRKDNPEEIHKKVMSAAEILGLTQQLNKKPRELSGGQRQRVAMGRAIVRNPKVFLFDEPLSNLDAKLRNSMRREIKLLHHRLGTTMIYVTHDQTEALTLADRIVVMSMGRVQQIGTPYEVYHKPANAFVGYFIGNPSMNFLEGKVEGNQFIGKDGFVYDFDESEIEKLASHDGKSVLMATRPEAITLDGNYEFKVDLVEHLGQYSLIHGAMYGYRVIIKVLGWKNIQHDEIIHIGFKKDKVCFFDIDNGARIGG
jgi:multiple sugar transport system ATP-binding protein